MPSFTPDLARALGGPAWLLPRRLEAAERAVARAFPTVEEEIWRYSRIAELDLAAFTPTRATSRIESEAHAGLRAGPLEEGDLELLGGCMATPTDLLAEWNDALGAEPLIVKVAAGQTIAQPVVVTHEAGPAGSATFPRLVIEAGANSEVTVVERFVSTADGPTLTCPVLELRAHPAARVRYLAVNELSRQAWLIASQVSEGERDSTTQLAAVSLGGDYARIRTDARLVGQGASGEQMAIYFGEGNQMHDIRTLQDHAAPKTTSNLLFKGAVEGHSQSVYTGLIKVRKEARGTVAFQTNRNLKLSEGTWAESVPNLEIDTNDVRCSHASAVGPIDEDQRFYLESRGIPTAVAERLIVLGFFDEVLTRLPVPALLDHLRAEVAHKLDRRDL